MKLWLTDRLLNLAGGIIGGVSFAAGLWFQRNRLGPLLRRDNHATEKERGPYDPVAAVVRSIQNLRTKLGKP
jgi:hypothetical protein